MHLREAVDAVICDCVADRAAAGRALQIAREAAAELGELAADGARDAAVARVVAAIVHSLWLEAPLDAAGADELLSSFERATAVPAAMLAFEVLGHHAQLQLPPDLAVDTHVDMLVALCGARHASLWVTDARGRVSCRSRAGTSRSPAGARELVQTLLDGPGDVPVVAGTLVAAPVLRWRQPHGVVIAQASAGAAPSIRMFVQRSAETLALMLERKAMLDGGARAEQTIAGATERRLARLGLDLHDGPLQAVIGAARELERCRALLPQAVSIEEESARVSGWLEDFEERLAEIESELRDYSSSLGTPGVLRGPLADTLTQAVEVFRERSGIPAVLDLSGDLHALTHSQQIAIARIVQEGLNNARAHSRASEVKVTVAATRDHVRAVVVDDGIGFDMERTLVRAAASGRLGLLGMDERVRLLGGTFRIRSRDGGPTELTVMLPRWDAGRPFQKTGESA